ncbi:hypothetical protein K504DRAFT_493944 [Pleomassaria siparia CBS 279.74]|uniref:Uncharacterized protein n=1 Tax=Pleomassaria siparia CBS 279.74 TaxID=1314801 RepID=A0A6G1JZ08_9PLEO|nr:hypothetical protein K504DRAFT_493944 [Pleomassaria siparia CBS 279.74]
MSSTSSQQTLLPQHSAARSQAMAGVKEALQTTFVVSIFFFITILLLAGAMSSLLTLWLFTITITNRQMVVCTSVAAAIAIILVWRAIIYNHRFRTHIFKFQLTAINNNRDLTDSRDQLRDVLDKYNTAKANLRDQQDTNATLENILQEFGVTTQLQVSTSAPASRATYL